MNETMTFQDMDPNLSIPKVSKVLSRVAHVFLHLLIPPGVLRHLLLEEGSLRQQLLVGLLGLQQLRMELQLLLGEVCAHLSALNLGLGKLGVV